MKFPVIDLDGAIQIGLTAVLTGAVTLLTTRFSAKRAITDEFTKLRHSRGFQRQARWYEHARDELRQLRSYGGLLIKTTSELHYGGFARPLYKDHFRAIRRVNDLLLSAAVYATPSTVAVLADLSETLEELYPYLTVLTGTVQGHADITELNHGATNHRQLPNTILAEEQALAHSHVGTIHGKMAIAINHILEETRELHGYSPLGDIAALTGSAIVGATLDPPPKQRLFRKRKRKYWSEC